ncbi:MAG: hypothetical protein WCK37_02050 [Candidatus Falkowbacteria bacterium]
MREVDDYLLRQFQLIADKIQFLFGINCFSLARLMIVVSLTLRMCSVKAHLINEVMSLVYLSGVIFVFLGLLYLWFFLRTAERSWTNNTGLLGFGFYFLSFARILAIVLTPFIIYGAFNSLFLSEAVNKYKFLEFGFQIVAYIFGFFSIFFGSCTPKPPKISWVKKILNKIKEKLPGGLVAREPQLR